MVFFMTEAVKTESSALPFRPAEDTHYGNEMLITPGRVLTVSYKPTEFETQGLRAAMTLILYIERRLYKQFSLTGSALKRLVEGPASFEFTAGSTVYRKNARSTLGVIFEREMHETEPGGRIYREDIILADEEIVYITAELKKFAA